MRSERRRRKRDAGSGAGDVVYVWMRITGDEVMREVSVIGCRGENFINLDIQREEEGKRCDA